MTAEFAPEGSDVGGDFVLLLAPWVNIGGIANGLIGQILGQLAEVLGRGAAHTFENFYDWFTYLDPGRISTGSGGPFIWGPPDCTSPSATPQACALLHIWNDVFFGQVTGLALVLLVVAVYTKSVLSIFDIGSRRSVFRTKRGMHFAFMMVIMWYPLTVGFIALVNAIVGQFLPGSTSGTFLKGLANQAEQIKISALPGSNVTPLNFLLVSLSGILAAMIRILFEIRILAVFSLLYTGPLLIVIQYIGIKPLEAAGKRLIYLFVGLVLLPLAVAIPGRLYGQILFSGEGLSAIASGIGTGATRPAILVVGFEVIVLYFSWRLLRLTDDLPQVVQSSVDRVETYTAGVDVPERIQQVSPAYRTGETGSDVVVEQTEYRRIENEPGDTR